jgi:hypothetical protein
MTRKKELPSPPLTADLRAVLKAIIQNELNNLPELLENLEPVERLNFICKLLGYVLPKVVSVNARDGEPFVFNL